MMNVNGIQPVQVGANVPDLEMETYDPARGQFGKLSLAELKAAHKWTILVFYPADFTFVCPTELADLAEKYAAVQAWGAEVASVSTDTKFAHLAWQASEKPLAGVHYPMAADPTGDVARLFGAYDAATGLALRGTFIISPAGKLVSAEVNDYNVGRNADELLRKMQANAYLIGHPDEVCPAKWHEGARTLKPSEQRVGKAFDALH